MKKQNHYQQTHSKPQKLRGINRIIKAHIYAGKQALRTLALSPLASLLTVLVIAVTIALPTLFVVLLNNGQWLSQDFAASGKITLYLKIATPQSSVDDLLQQLRQEPGVAEVTYISPDEGLHDFERESGFTQVLQLLPQNPLPPVIEIIPSIDARDYNSLNQLLQQFQQLPQVDTAHLDFDWIKRLYAMISLIKHGLIAISIILACAMMLIIGNTLRLMIQNHKTAILVEKMVGATNAFVRRPFLYLGTIFGVIGAVLAAAIINLVLTYLNYPFQHLVFSYGNNVVLQGLTWNEFSLLLIVSVLLGWLSAGITVQVEVKKITE